jgi:hypothetical protein
MLALRLGAGFLIHLQTSMGKIKTRTLENYKGAAPQSRT